jgi:hypothetical protein
MTQRRSAVLLAAVLLASGCASAESEANVPDHITFTKATPGGLSAKAKAALVELPADSRNRHHGIVLAVTARDDWYLRVLGRDGVAVLYQGDCWLVDGAGHQQPEDQMRQVAAPGDAIVWTSTTNALCPDQLKVTEVGAVS